MAGRKVAVDFDKIIQTGTLRLPLASKPQSYEYRSDRTRRKNEALADDIFNRGRRQSAPGAAAFRKPGTGPSLASRVGISKVSDILPCCVQSPHSPNGKGADCLI